MTAEGDGRCELGWVLQGIRVVRRRGGSGLPRRFASRNDRVGLGYFAEAFGLALDEAGYFGEVGGAEAGGGFA